MGKIVTLMILDDGTWITASGSRLVVISEEDFNMLSRGHIGVQELEPLSEITLRETTPQPPKNNF